MTLTCLVRPTGRKAKDSVTGLRGRVGIFPGSAWIEILGPRGVWIDGGFRGEGGRALPQEADKTQGIMQGWSLTKKIWRSLCFEKPMVQKIRLSPKKHTLAPLVP